MDIIIFIILLVFTSSPIIIIIIIIITSSCHWRCNIDHGYFYEGRELDREGRELGREGGVFNISGVHKEVGLVVVRVKGLVAISFIDKINCEGAYLHFISQ